MPQNCMGERGGGGGGASKVEDLCGIKKVHVNIERKIIVSTI